MSETENKLRPAMTESKVDIRGVIAATIAELRADGNTGMVENLLAADESLSTLLDAGERLQLDRVGIRNAEMSGCHLVAPMLDLVAVLDFNAALAACTPAKEGGGR